MNDMENIRAIGSIESMADSGKRHHGSMSEALRKEREKLFVKVLPARVHKRPNKAIDETPTASYFSNSAERFRSRYKHTHKTKHDLQMVLIFLAQQFDVDVDAVLSKSRKMPLPMVRKYYSFFTYYYFMQTQQKIAELINRERSTVATSIQYAINDLECYAKSRDIAHRVDKFIHDISDRRKHEI